MSHILFRLCGTEDAQWLNSAGIVQCGSLEQLAAQVGKARLSLVVPGELATLHRIPLPSPRRSWWQRAAPFALEDQLIAEVADLHFAVAAQAVEQQLAIVTVPHQILRDWLASCATYQLFPTTLVPDLLLLPQHSDGWSVVSDGDRYLVRTGRWSGFVSSAATWEWFLATALDECATPPTLHVYGTVPDLPAGLAWQRAAQECHLLQLAARHSTATINLLQGQYARQTAWQRGWRPWRSTALLAGLLLLAQGAHLLYQHQQLQVTLATLRSEMERVYKDAVPGATRIVNPRAQLEAHLRQLLPTAPKSGTFFELLQATGQVLAGFPQLQLLNLQYRERQLELTLQGGAAASLDALRQGLHQAGLAVTMRSAQQQGTMTSNITVRRGAP